MARSRARAGARSRRAHQTGRHRSEEAARALAGRAVIVARARRKTRDGVHARAECRDICPLSRADARDRGVAGDRSVDESAG